MKEFDLYTATAAEIAEENRKARLDPNWRPPPLPKRITSRRGLSSNPNQGNGKPPPKKSA